MARNLADLIPAIFVGKGGAPLTQDQIKARQAVAQSLLKNATDSSPTAGGWASVIGKGVQGFAAGYQNRSADRGAQAASKADSDLSAALLGSYGGANTAIPSPAASGQIAATSPAVNSNSTLPPSFLAVLDQTEGGGGYDTLFGNAQKGQFAGTDVSKMPISDVLAFTDPNGPYAQSVKSQIGRVATPVGRHQIVGTTLRNAVGALGLDPNTPFSPETQDNVALYLAKQRIASSNTPEGKLAALRNEWEGFRKVPDSQLLQVVSDIENYQPTQVASADPQTASDAIAAVSPPSGYVDPQVTTAYQAPMPVTSAPIAPIGQAQTVSDPTIAPAQDISPVAQALIAPMKGDRLGATTSQNFSDRFGASAAEQAAPEIYSQPQDFPAAQQIPVQPTPQQAPVAAVPSLPAIQPPPALPPAVIQALSSPYASESTKRVAYSLLQQNQQQQQDYRQAIAEANDPLKKIQLQQAQLNLQKAQNEANNPFANVPDSVRALQIRAQEAGLVPGTPQYTNFMLNGGDRGITINNEGAVPAGMRAVRDDQGRILQYEPIPGSPAANDAVAAATKAKNSQDLKDVAANTVVSSIGKALDAFEAPGLPATGTIGNMMAPISESNSAALRRQLATVKSNITMDSLQAARAASPTGAALGAVSDKEGELLANKIGSLDPSSPTFDRDILDVQKTYLQTVYGQDAGSKLFDQSVTLRNARKAIAKGAPRDAVIKRLQDAGIDPEGL